MGLAPYRVRSRVPDVRLHYRGDGSGLGDRMTVYVLIVMTITQFVTREDLHVYQSQVECEAAGAMLDPVDQWTCTPVEGEIGE